MIEVMPIQSEPDENDSRMPYWRQALLARLTRGVGRTLIDADQASLAWNETAGTLTVQSSALLSELRRRGVASNVFRSRLLRQ
jgi:hypothetical protein